VTFVPFMQLIGDQN